MVNVNAGKLAQIVSLCNDANQHFADSLSPQIADSLRPQIERRA